MLAREKPGQARLAEPARVGGAGVALKKRERDLAVQIAKQAQRSGPEALKLGPQLVAKRGPRADEILPPAGQRPQRLRRIRVRLEHPEAVIVGARQLAQHERVKPIRLAARHAKPIAGRRDLIGMQGQHPQPRIQQPLDQQPVRTLDRDQLDSQAHQLPAQRPHAVLIMRERRGQKLLTRRISDEHIVLLRRPINTCIRLHLQLPLLVQDNSTAPRPRGTVADAYRQALNWGYVLSPLGGTSPTVGRGWSSNGPPTQRGGKR